ncbi:unnamed protein product [Arabidopsis halleri]
MAHIDRISHLPEELLLRILSLLPTKDVVFTMVLSKRWKFLWMLVPRLEYDHGMYRDDDEEKRFSRFVYSSLLLHEAPVLESFRFKLDWKPSAIDIGVWVRTAVKRCVRELDIKIRSPRNSVILPWSLYSEGCRMLVTLKLSNTTLVDASSLPASSFPSLKNLSLVYMKYPSEKFVNEFLSNCPVLEDLVVVQCPDDNVTVLTVKIPSLKSLSLSKTWDLNYSKEDEACGFVIDAPLLDCFDIDVDRSYGGFCTIMNNMPRIVYANLNIGYGIRWKILGSITSVKRLYLCLSTTKNAYPVGTVFHRLVHLTLYTCGTKWLELLMCLLRDSPKLQVLKFKHCNGFRGDIRKPRPFWNEPNSVPGCVLSSLETLEWVEYKGTEEEKEVVAFIFRSASFASCLNQATIICSESIDHDKKLEMLNDFPVSSRRSPACLLAFCWNLRSEF